MADPNVTLSSTTISCKTEAPTTLFLSFDNSGGSYNCTLVNMYGECSSPSNGASAIVFEERNMLPSYAGTGVATPPISIASGAAATVYPLQFVAHKAGTYTISIVVSGTRTDTGAAQIWMPTSAATVTVTAAATPT
jgi:hypothetical protein